MKIPHLTIITTCLNLERLIVNCKCLWDSLLINWYLTLILYPPKWILHWMIHWKICLNNLMYTLVHGSDRIHSLLLLILMVTMMIKILMRLICMTLLQSICQTLQVSRHQIWMGTLLIKQTSMKHLSNYLLLTL